jgi:isocitrate dehydrogenase
MFKRVTVAVAKGDGIGSEIMDATLKVLKAAKVPLDFIHVDMGKEFYLKGFSTGMTPEARGIVESTRILLKGPMETPKGMGVKSINVTARKVWSTYANKRVFQTLPGVETVFSKANIDINLTMFRENIEDTYGGIEHYQTHDVVQCRRLITRVGSEQIHRAAFEVAKNRKGARITCGHKSNIMKLTDGLFLKTFYEIAKEYPNVKVDDAIIDDLAMKLVTRPDKYDIIVLPNLQGDIMSDLCAGLVGGLGMAPSANLGDEISIFEAVHGTAPDIAGKNIANPTALLMSSLMMLRYMGLNYHAKYIESGLKMALKKGIRTSDLTPLPGCKSVSTTEFVEGIIECMKLEKFIEPKNIEYMNIKQDCKKPELNKMMITPRNELEETIGVDIFIDSELYPFELANKLKTMLPENVELIMISNRGTQVWPTGSVFTQCVNHYRCRIQSKIGTDETKLLNVVCNISKKMRVCSLEMLRKIGGKDMFTLAQGQ